MGLDWLPGPKPRPGCEQEFVRLWAELQSKDVADRDRKVTRFGEITTTPFETLKAPRVGFDAAADRWAREAFNRRVDKSLPLDRFVSGMKGFYVLDLVPPCDGLPLYTNGSPGGDVERFSFRGQFLTDCTDIIGTDLLEQGYVSKLQQDTKRYGVALLNRADQFAAEHSIDVSKTHLAEDPDSVEFHLDAVFAAGKWCEFWAARGHWLEAYW